MDGRQSLEAKCIVCAEKAPPDNTPPKDAHKNFLIKQKALRIHQHYLELLFTFFLLIILILWTLFFSTADRLDMPGQQRSDEGM